MIVFLYLNFNPPMCGGWVGEMQGLLHMVEKNGCETMGYREDRRFISNTNTQINNFFT